MTFEILLKHWIRSREVIGVRFPLG